MELTVESDRAPAITLRVKTQNLVQQSTSRNFFWTTPTFRSLHHDAIFRTTRPCFGDLASRSTTLDPPTYMRQRAIHATSGRTMLYRCGYSPMRLELVVWNDLRWRISSKTAHLSCLVPGGGSSKRRHGEARYADSVTTGFLGFLGTFPYLGAESTSTPV